jgi:membrane protein DedA with SNARE-associated domain
VTLVVYDNFFKHKTLNQEGKERLEFPNIIQQIYEWMSSLAIQYGYLGIFLISLIGAMSIFFPIPYTVIIFTLGGLKDEEVYVFEPLWIAVAAGIGAAIGEFSGYLLGVGGRKILSEKYRRKMDFLTKVFNKFGLITIFLFALTPLPDDLLFIPLGVMRYSIAKAFIPALIGKFCMNFIVAYSGRLSIHYIEQIFGVESEWASALIGMVIAIILLIIVFVVMFKVDWEKRFGKYVAKEVDSGVKNAGDC